MLHLPNHLSVQLRDTSGEALPVSDILTAANFYWRGRYYFRTLIGLTDGEGVATTTAEEIERQFERNQLLFPMDYRVKLVDCDEEVEVLLLSDQQVVEARAAVDHSKLASAEVRGIYRQAQNKRLEPSTAHLDMGEKGAESVMVTLTTSHAGK